METNNESTFRAKRGATVVITHRVQPGRETEYEAWLNTIAPRSKSALGHLDWQTIRPLAGVTSTYSTVIRFESHEHLQAWMSSEDRQLLIRQVSPILAEGDRFHVQSGLDFWFEPKVPVSAPPVRWKQVLVAWSAIYPLVLLVPLVVAPAMRALGWDRYGFVPPLFLTGIVVTLMTYVVMPRYTRLVKKWLY